MLSLMLMSLLMGNKNTVTLEYQKPITMELTSARLIIDTHFIIQDNHTLLVFERSGRFINAIGSKGQGPGEFEAINSATLINGNYLLVTDFPQRRITLFSFPDGQVINQYSSKSYFAYPGLAADPDHFFLFQIDWNLAKDSIEKGYTKDVLYYVSIQSFAEDMTHPRTFHKPSNQMQKWMFNDSEHWVVETKDEIAVTDLLSPKVDFYHSESLKKSRSEVIHLPNFIPPPKKFPGDELRKFTYEEYRNWWFSFSRILDFHTKGDKYFFAYVIPSETPGSPVYKIAFVIINGKGEILYQRSMDGHYETDTWVMSSTSKEWGYIQDISEELLPVYEVSLFNW